MQGGTTLWLRWSWRDLKRRWVQLIITALVIALGTGLFAGLSSVSRWRTQSNEDSFAITLYHDLRVSLGAGHFLPQGALASALEGVAGLPLEALEERLVLPTQVEVTAGDELVVVPGRLVAYDFSHSEPSVDRLHLERGRLLGPDDEGAATALFERNFGKHYGLGEAGTLRLAGGHELTFVGQAVSPEYFMVVTDEAGFLAEANFGVVFTSLATAQAIAGLEGQINDLVVRLQPGVDVTAAEQLVRDRVAAFGATVVRGDEEDAYRLLTEDAKGDQQVYTVFAMAILAGAVFAAFNITSRMVEAQRREFGIAMALGVSPLQIAMRPLLVGVQIALLGVAFGIGVGLLVGWGMGAVLRGFLVMPVLETPFQFDIFALVAIGGFLAPMLAIAYPVWRAVRVPPIRAIRTGHVAVRPPGMARLAGRIPVPGDTFFRMPLRNLVRAPRRALLTGLGIAAIISVLVALLGYLDSFFDALDRVEAETSGDYPARLDIDLDRFYTIESPEAAAVFASGALEAAEPRLRLGASFLAGGERIDGLLEFVDMSSPLWRPTPERGSLPSGPGIVIATTAARDLGVSVGETITVRHPVRAADGTFALVETELTVAATHPHPIRIYAYMDLSQAGLVGLDGAINRVTALPGDGGLSSARDELFDLPGIVSVQEVSAAPRLLRERIKEFSGVFQVIIGGLFVLAALIAVNTASINLDERSRENATMLAYGIPPHIIIRMAVVEGLALGVLATFLGLIGGYFLASYFIDVLAPQVMPDLGLNTVLSPTSAATVILLGVVSIGMTPLFGWRRLRRTNIPSALRLME